MKKCSACVYCVFPATGRLPDLQPDCKNGILFLHHVYTINGKSNEIQVFSSISLFLLFSLPFEKCFNGLFIKEIMDTRLVEGYIFLAEILDRKSTRLNSSHI